MDEMMKVNVRTCCRVDFAGGTLDLYPLYLFLDGGVTINAGITVYSRVSIEKRGDAEIHIKSEDLGVESMFSSVDELTLKGPTSFIQRAVKSYRPGFGVNIVTKNDAPKGSGLGASSSLLMALSAGLIKIQGGVIDVGEMIRRGGAIEAGHLGIPTGLQDYYGAVLGNLNALHFDEKGCSPEPIAASKDFFDEINGSLVVSYTGISHYSGANNWDMIKNTIDRKGRTYESLTRIRQISLELQDALLDKDIEKAAHYVNEEWQARKHLSPGVTNDYIDLIIENAEKAGAWSSKLCGAGGGGCMITLVPPGLGDEVRKSLEESGAKVMDARICHNGLVVS